MGPAQVVFRGHERYVLFANPAQYGTPVQLVAAGMTLATQAAAIHKITPGGLQLVAEVWEPEFTQNYDSDDINSNPFSAIAYKNNIFIVDAGANAVVKVTGNTVVPITVFPTKTRPCLPAVGPCTSGPIAPFCCGFPGGSATYPAQPVPTSSALHPTKPEFYVAELTGIFWQNSVASIHRLNANTGQMLEQDFLTGFTSIHNIAFYDANTLLVLELSVFGGLGADSNRLWSVNLTTKERTLVQANLTGATGLAVMGNKVYIANNALDFPAGQCVGTLLVGTIDPQ
jgi:hypothetical protein